MLNVDFSLKLGNYTSLKRPKKKSVQYYILGSTTIHVHPPFIRNNFTEIESQRYL